MLIKLAVDLGKKLKLSNQSFENDGIDNNKKINAIKLV